VIGGIRAAARVQNAGSDAESIDLNQTHGTSRRKLGVLRGRALPAMMATMKRLATWGFYAIGALAVGYLLLYVTAWLTAPDLTPGEPIRIFRKPDAPNYS
jgi:hypothetical protein